MGEPGRQTLPLRGVRAQIFLWTILPLILLLVAVTLGSIALHQRSMRRLVAERNVQLAEATAARLDTELRARARELELLLTLPSAQIAKSIPPETAATLSIFDAQGNSILAPSHAGARIEAEIRRAASAARADAGAPLTLPRSAPAGETDVLLALHNPASARTAVLQLGYEDLNLPPVFTHEPDRPYPATWIFAADGNPLFHPADSVWPGALPTRPWVAAALRGKTGSAFENPGSQDRTPHVIGYAPVAATGWTVFVEEPWDGVVVPALRYTLWAPLLALIVAVVSLVTIDFGLRRIVRPLHALGKMAGRVAWGDAGALHEPVGGISEIRALQRSLQEMVAQIDAQRAGMEDYVAALTEAQEEERRRLAREIHDETLPSLIALQQRVHLLELNRAALLDPSAHTQPSALDDPLRELNCMITFCLRDVRGIIRDLHPVYLEELGLEAALASLVRNASGGDTGNKLKARLKIRGPVRRLAPQTELSVYRIAQAAINNARQHGRPGQIAVTADFGDARITVEVRDDGVGFVPPKRPADLALHGHYGLMGMVERAARHGGHLTIESAPGAGTRIAATLPYAEPSRPHPGAKRAEVPARDAPFGG